MQAFKKYKKAEYKALLDSDVDLRRWYFNNAKSSVITADVYLRRLGGFCREMKVTPGSYAKLPKRKMENMAFEIEEDLGVIVCYEDLVAANLADPTIACDCYGHDLLSEQCEYKD
jgi:hypothetical protein